MKKILFLSFYYSPDLSAGSFRSTALIESMLKLTRDQSVKIDVITTLPNRYRSFSAEAPELEVYDRLRVKRISLPAHKSGMVDQSRSFLTYAFHAREFVKYETYDLVYATSSRLMTAVLGANLANKKQVPLYLDIRDIFVDTLEDVLKPPSSYIFGSLFSLFEKKAFNQASKINLVSKGFKSYFFERYPQKTFSYFTNGIDDEFLEPTNFENLLKTSSNSLITILYAGNIGEGQGLHKIIPKLAKKLEGKVCFKIFGDGGRKEALIDAMRVEGVLNVTICPPVSRKELLREYQMADVLFLHLNDYDAFKKVLPSKIFEYAALGKPIWAGVPGYSSDFLRTEVENSAVFAPGNVSEAMEVFGKLELHSIDRSEFKEKYARSKISDQLALDVLSLL